MQVGSLVRSDWAGRCLLEWALPILVVDLVL